MNWAVLVAALAAVIIFGGSAVATRVAVSAISALDVSIMRTVIGGLFALLLLPLAPFVIDGPSLQSAGSYAWLGLLYQAIGVTIVAYILWYWALGTGGIARVGLFQFLQPVSGVIFAWLILAENLSLIFILASSIIMLGVVLAFRAR
jgi:drug/metabolite transporter (DMT)-like permease